MQIIRFLLFFCLIFLGAVVHAQEVVCKPVGMTNEEAMRVGVIATAQGENFRREIDAMRARGISKAADTTLSDILADPIKTLELAREYFDRRAIVDSWTRYRLDQGATLDEILRESSHPLQPAQVNYFAVALDEALQGLAGELGEPIPESVAQYHMDPNAFVYALGQFMTAADLQFFRDWVSSSTSRQLFAPHRSQEIRFSYRESNRIGGPDGRQLAHIIVSTISTRDEMAIRAIFYRGYDYVTNFDLRYYFGNSNCPTEFTEKEIQ